jgi:hypothetical protein
MNSFPIVAVRSFIEATRDTGYKSTGAAIAELVDNSFEASASTVDIRIEEMEAQECKELTVRVTDDGTGMPPNVLRLALQFGGSTRFGSRTAAGRYGMGLPNGSLSQARRVEVFTWTRPSQVWRSYLDVDEIASGQLLDVPQPRPFEPPSLLAKTTSGTVVTWTKCDRLDYRRIRTLEEKLSLELGRVFRKFLYAGKRLLVNGQIVRPLDPLFLQAGQNLTGAEPFGPPLEYRVRVPGTADAVSTTVVRFSELPIERWHELSNEEKNRSRIAKHAGVSIVRANREIDYGWYFMGSKRKENYDDWWRCEVSFTPELDELFGVTHSKQKINPTDALSDILVPEIERAARELNSRVRRKYASIRREAPTSKSLRKLEARDYLLEPPAHQHRTDHGKEPVASGILRAHNGGIEGLRFRVAHKTSIGNSFYEPALKKGRLDLILNESHPFFSSVYRPLETSTMHMERATLEHVLTLLFAGARAECSLEDRKQRKIIHRFREHWSDTLAAFLS